MAKRTLTITDRKLAEGFYQFKVLEFTEETDPKKGYDFFKVKMATVSMEDGKSQLSWDRFPLTEDLEWKFISFLVSTGHVKESGEIEWDDALVVGTEGFFEVKHNENTEGTRTFANFRYLHPDDERVVGLEAPTIEPVHEKRESLISKLRASAKNGASANGESIGHIRVGQNHSEVAS